MSTMTKLTEKFLDCSHVKPLDKTGKQGICKCKSKYHRERKNLRMYYRVTKDVK